MFKSFIVLIFVTFCIIFEDVSTKKTPQKVYRREAAELYSDYCRLCDTSTENRRLVRIFSAAGNKKGLQTKIFKTCGVMIKEEDYLPKVICRKCGIFVDKMFEFIETCKTSQTTLNEHYGVKRGTLTSPPCNQPVKRTCVLPEFKDSSTRRELGFSEVQTNQSLPSEVAAATSGSMKYTTEMSIHINNPSEPCPVQYVSIQTIVPNQPMCPLRASTSTLAEVPISRSAYISNYHTYVTTPLTSSQQAKLERATSTKIPTAVADVVTKECPSVEMAMKRNILNKIKTSSDSVCKRLYGSSVLYSSKKQFDAMENFSIEKIWLEMKSTQPFLIDLLNTITGNEVDIDKTSEEVKVKFCFIYSILMNVRWHELSLFQRVNTVLL